MQAKGPMIVIARPGSLSRDAESVPGVPDRPALGPRRPALVERPEPRGASGEAGGKSELNSKTKTPKYDPGMVPTDFLNCAEVGSRNGNPIPIPS